MLSRIGPTKTFQLFRKNSPSNFRSTLTIKADDVIKKESLGKENTKRKKKRMNE